MDMEDQKEDTEDQTGAGLTGSLTVSFLLNPLFLNFQSVMIMIIIIKE